MFVAYFIDLLLVEASDVSNSYAQTDAAFAHVRARFGAQNQALPYCSHIAVCYKHNRRRRLQLQKYFLEFQKIL